MSSGMRCGRLLGIVVGGCAAVVLFGMAGIADTARADGYRYWSYWQVSDDDWTYATSGPGTHEPTDGQVDGWRFTAGAEGQAAKPRAEPDFDRICAGIKIRDGYKRVALVIDYGTPADAPADSRPPRKKPATTCMVAQEDASSVDVLNKAQRTRSAPDGLLCAIDGYPARGCGDTASGGSPSTAATPTGGEGGAGPDPSTAIAIAAGLAIGAAVVATMYARHRRENG